FRTRAQFLDFKPENGMQVEVRARVTLYEPRGSYQLVVEELRRAGLGALFEAFEKLKTRLDAEGLFDASRKRPLPGFPRAIGVVTSPHAAALRDVLTTLRRRAPMTPVILYPAPVQGEGAAPLIARAITAASRRGECDVLIVCRGGGSLEDLWSFNEEVVARAIHACAIPVVSGVGHETDFSIADFVADLRAPTPTAAAVAASTDREARCGELAALRKRMGRDLRRMVETRQQRLDGVARRLLTPAERLARERERLAQWARRLKRDVSQPVAARRQQVEGLARRLKRAGPHAAAQRALRLAALRNALGHLDPTRVLARGYSIVRDADGHVRRSSEGLAAGATLDVTFSRGGAEVGVKKTR
ncbi:MAG TPA: exodeoxyribonuclease VII large subunit, partial [Usitatibacter sp.]|nr:exodeoxyribonuclease VII large subunit [Usitatibacter sp.]